jgi:hypothetical protein
MALIGSPNRPARAAHQGLPIRQHRLSPERHAGTLHLLWLTEVETSQRVALRRPRGSAARRSPRSRRSKTGGPGPALRVSRVNVLLGRRSLVRARNGMAALARTPIFPEATPVGALSAQERNRSRGSRGERALGSNEPLEATALSPRGCLLRAGLRFESPPLHQEIRANRRDFLRHRIARHFRSLPSQGPVSVGGPAILRGNSRPSRQKSLAANFRFQGSCSLRVHRPRIRTALMSSNSTTLHPVWMDG